MSYSPDKNSATDDFPEKMKHKSFRWKRLEGILESDEILTQRFAEDVPYWIDSGDIKPLENILNKALEQKRFDAHKACIVALGEAIFSEKNDKLFLMSEKSSGVSCRVKHLGLDNPTIKPSDSYKTLCTFLMMNPIGAIDRGSLFGKKWTNEALKEENAENTFGAVVIGLHRACEAFDMEMNRDGLNELMGYSSRLGFQTGLEDGFTELVSKLPAPESLSSKVRKIVNKINGIYAQRSYHISSVIKSSESSGFPARWVEYQNNLFQLGIKFKLLDMKAFSIETHKDIYSTRDKWYQKLVDSPYVDIKTLRKQFDPELVSQKNIDSLHEKGYLTEVLKYKSAEDLEVLIGRDISLPRKAVPKVARRVVLENDLGL